MHQDILESLDTAVVLIAKDHSVRYINPAAGELLGVSTRRILATPLATFMPEIARQLSLHATAQRLTLHDVPFVRADQKSLRLNCMMTPVELPVAGWIIEMLPRSRVDRISQEEALWAQYEVSTQLARTLAHEIKNPLAGIWGAAQLLSRQLPREDLQEFVAVILRETQRLNGLLERMLTGNQPVQWVTQNVHAVIEHVLHVMRGQWPADIQVVKDYDPSIPELLMDFDGLVQVFLNLVRNAIEAMQGQGVLTIRSRIHRKMTLGNRLYPLVIGVEVVDTGEGIASELMDAIFLPMITNKKGGTGLGLSIAQSIVHQHGGLIRVDSRPGLTQFQVFLPIREPAYE